MSTQQEYKLELVDLLFLRCIDGTKDIRAIKNEMTQLLSYEISHETLWKAIDSLSDIGILQSELAPPSGGQLTSRRGFLAKVAGSIAIGTAITSTPVFAQSQQDPKNAEEKQKEEAVKNQQSGGGDPVSVSSPATLSLLAIGAASIAILKLRNKKNKDDSEPED